MQCDVDHPCQTLADLMTIREKLRRRPARAARSRVSWAYAPSYAKPLSVPQGLIMLMPRFGMDVTLAHPPEYHADAGDAGRGARQRQPKAGTKFEVVDDMDAAFEGADVVYPEELGLPGDDGQQAGGVAAASPGKYTQLDLRRSRAWSCAKPEALYMHRLPADRGNEVTDEVIDGPQSVVYDEAENRLHTAKAIMALTMADQPVEYDAP